MYQTYLSLSGGANPAIEPWRVLSGRVLRADARGAEGVSAHAGDAPLTHRHNGRRRGPRLGVTSPRRAASSFHP
jgi:hypothetical protein